MTTEREEVDELQTSPTPEPLLDISAEDLAPILNHPHSPLVYLLVRCPDCGVTYYVAMREDGVSVPTFCPFCGVKANAPS